MNLEEYADSRKFWINICNHPEQKVFQKLNFLSFMGRFKTIQKIIS